MIEAAHAHAGAEQAQQGGPVALHRQVKAIDFVARVSVHTLEQRDLALQPGLQRGRRRLVEPPLQRSAQAIGIADIESLRCHSSCHRGETRFANSYLVVSSRVMTSSSSI